MKKSKVYILSVLLVSFLLVLVGCESGAPIFGTGNTIKGVVTDADTPIEGVTVSIVELNISTTTNAQGTYIFENIEDGEYTIKFSQDGKEHTESVVAAGGNTSTIDLDVSELPTDPGTDPTVDVEGFITGLNENGVLLQETYAEQVSKLSTNIEQTVAPHLGAMESDLMYTMGFADAFFSMEDWYKEKGNYTWDWRSMTFEPNVSAEFNGPIVDDWTLYIPPNGTEFTTTDTITIELTNEKEIYDSITVNSVSYETINFSRAVFRYNHTSQDSTDTTIYQASLNMGFAEYTDIFEEQDDELQEIYILPRDFIFAVNGSMYSEHSYSGLPQGLGTATMDLTLDVDVDPDTIDNYVSLTGNFNSDAISFSGELDGQIASIPAEGPFEDAIPSRMEVTGTITTSVFELNGGYLMTFPDGISSPDQIEPDSITFSGTYKDLDNAATTEDEATLVADGSLTITPDSSAEDSLNVSFDGSLDSDNFATINLTTDLVASRNFDNNGAEYGVIDGTLRIDYDTDKYLTGDIVADQVAGLTLVLVNENGLKIDLAVNDFESYNESRIGEIRDTNENILADIYVTDYQWEVHYNGSVLPLFY